MTAPFFSVVLPTRNRAKLLPTAIQSILNQTFGDFELVLSNNCSEDETETVVRSFTDPRIRYVTTPQAFSMTESWEFALREAKGQFIGFISDDDFLLPSTLERVAQVLNQHQTEIVSWELADYFYPEWYLEETQNHLRLRPFTGQTYEVPALEGIHSYFQTLGGYLWAPRMLQSVVSRACVERVLARYQRVFMPPAPDSAAAMLLLGEVDHFVHLNLPLLVYGHSRTSNRPVGLCFDSGQTSNWEAYMADVRKNSQFQFVPVSAVTWSSSVAETLLRVKATLGERLGEIPFNWEGFFRAYTSELLELQWRGAALEPFLGELEKVVADFPEPVRQGVAESLSLKPTLGQPAPRTLARKLIDHFEIFQDLENSLRPIPKLGPVEFAGKTAGFNHIEAAGAWLHHRIDRGFRKIMKAQGRQGGNKS
ncbi:MAG: glycosyltransferase [Blastocatellia bacterium]|nr:glycosyltransferase [Blastocatellia bacterium]